jgi:hypothetical protein
LARSARGWTLPLPFRIADMNSDAPITAVQQWVDRLLIRGGSYALGGVAVLLFGGIWFAGSFVARELRWWNSLPFHAAVFAGAAFLGWRALPNLLGVAVLGVALLVLAVLMVLMFGG